MNATGVDSNFELRNSKKAFYPPTIRARPVGLPFVYTSASTPMGSIENPQPKSGTANPVPAKPTEQQPSTTAPTKVKPSEQQPSTITPAKPKQTESTISKPSATTA